MSHGLHERDRQMQKEIDDLRRQLTRRTKPLEMHDYEVGPLDTANDTSAAAGIVQLAPFFVPNILRAQRVVSRVHSDGGAFASFAVAIYRVRNARQLAEVARSVAGGSITRAPEFELVAASPDKIRVLVTTANIFNASFSPELVLEPGLGYAFAFQSNVAEGRWRGCSGPTSQFHRPIFSDGRSRSFADFPSEYQANFAQDSAVGPYFRLLSALGAGLISNR